ncbi:glycosyltransferase [Gilvibacter sediminis]|uniref:glycosyltransferase n=1 Tax=Gilvibacter sediminis TaxID=379071 RepID=UPI00234FF20E|nr:glycosyltransferase family 2 protein [Gilvibacter sediminis]MDC7997583.1 glycosyltransferase family 2 protein [Gilvibacter sediminis]
MKFGIIIPAHNEADHIGQTLDSLLNQSYGAAQIIVVDDGSTDETPSIVSEYAQSHPQLKLIQKPSLQEGHLPGSKVIAAFNFGLQQLDPEVDIICKYDADLIFPSNYLALHKTTFESNPKIGMVGGFCHILDKGDWVLENLTSKDHIRGALKAYRKACFEQIGGLVEAMGWDTVDELLTKYYGWQVVTLEELAVKHLKPTGQTYNKKARYKQGQAFYRMRYRLLLTVIASLKMAIRKKSAAFFFNTIIGYFKAWMRGDSFLLDKPQGAFMRKQRYRSITQKLIGR